MGRRWTDEDIQHLKLLAQRHPVPKIAEIMDRTVGGIVFKAHKLKVSLRSRRQGNARISSVDPGVAGFKNWPPEI
ncbi:hypothetical protein [Bradyrhizobium sp. JYMT SZCCT0428]|uniref:hypothetical protein n=1 Tax=Bradyrhizobium sp. JYMT SZCCT0428 TaxID=2807673 RepID=UPI001BAAC1B1|nr:hypothetical protein [Bradyrhizobium sp. JYMT SZCCT0428]MBR1151093.1 hypothetical protein [Bradyrhizobium sp. JYMT SZCCT0428]